MKSSILGTEAWRTYLSCLDTNIDLNSHDNNYYL